MNDGDGSEFATEPVPPERHTGWLKIAFVSAMVALSLPTFVTGIEVFRAVDGDRAVPATLLGCGILSLIAALCGAVGARTHLSSYMLTRIAFGDRGAAIVNLAFALSLLGWFGVNIDLFSEAIVRLAKDTADLLLPAWPIELGAGVVMTLTTLYGFSSINRLSIALVPPMLVVTALLLQAALGHPTSTAPLNTAAPMSFGNAVSAVVGGVIVGAVILPDITRFIRHWRGAVYTALLSYLLVQGTVMITGGLAAVALDNDDLLDMLLSLGLGWAAFLLIIAGSWVLNALNLYSTALSVEATFPEARVRLMIVLLGAFGTLAAFLNILDVFLTFLFYLAIVFVPVAGIIAVDHFLLRPAAYHHIDPAAARSGPALLAWLGGSAIALLGAEGLFTLSGVAALDAAFVAAGLYLLLGRPPRSPSPADP